MVNSTTNYTDAPRQSTELTRIYLSNSQ